MRKLLLQLTDQKKKEKKSCEVGQFHPVPPMMLIAGESERGGPQPHRRKWCTACGIVTMFMARSVAHGPHLATLQAKLTDV